MNLIIDIGNTRAKVARVEQDKILEVYTMSHDLVQIEDVACDCDSAIVSSVAREADIKLDIPVLQLTPDTPLPIAIEYSSRKTLGADRIAAAVGAWLVCPDRPCLIIDSGTCITYDIVLPGRGFVGGNISAGVNMRLRACHEFTGRLPLVDTGQLSDEIIGDSTEEAIRQGALLGVKLEMEGYVRTFAAKYDNLAVFITGGAAFHFDVPEKVSTFVRPYLVAEGLNAILEYNKCKQCN